MTDYLLFIDTEASGLPKKWNLSYSHDKNWPHIAQLSWIIYSNSGAEVKRENHFIGDNDFEISNSANKIHGITRHFLNKHGHSRREVLLLLTKDLAHYKPLVVGHFMEFDFNLVGIDSFRAGIENPFLKFATFCTMHATTHLVENPAKKYLNLCELHSYLFRTSLTNHHNAIEDARATARCFFELLRRGEIDEEKIERQKKLLEEPRGNATGQGCGLTLLAILLLVTLILTA